MRNSLPAIFIMSILMIILFAPISAASAPSEVSQHVQIESSISGGSEILAVPVNSSGLDVYPVWSIYLFGQGNFNFMVNGISVENGVSLGSFNFSYTFTEPNGYDINASLSFGNGVYSFHDILTGQLSNQVIESVSVSSSYPGQAQYLTVSPGTSGALMYPSWAITMESSQNVSFSIYLNGQEQISGNVLGSRVVDLNISGSTASVTVGLGSKIFKFLNELVASVPIQKYYGPKAPPLQYTLAEYEAGIIKAFVASFFGLMISLLVVRKYVIEREKREVHVS